jgi:hypothetical protein
MEGYPMVKARLLPLVRAMAVSLFSIVSTACPQAQSTIPQGETNVLPHSALAAEYFGNDAPWFEHNIPFFDCSDSQIKQIYYYRWKLYKSHLKDLGERGHIVTEFLDDVSWSLKPYESLNDATGFHINEGRWLRNRRYINEYIDFMYHGGNDRHFSEYIADATYAHFLVNGNRAFATKNLEEMKRIYRQWDDHYDASKGLYFIEPLADATEYTISSIDATGGKEGFRGGDAFRPSINSYMYANAVAISKLSAMAGDSKSADEFAAKAATLRNLVQRDLWNENFQHFIDRYKVNNQFVRYWDFIRGRELVGYTPWCFDLPEQDPKYVASWRHLLSPDRLQGPHGLRTVEPSYEYYMKQYRYVMEDGINKLECQWNGPSWPFQTTQALTGLANLLNNYPKQNVVGVNEYVRLLKQYTKQHYMNGQPDLQEDYNPDTGNVIVGLHRSHHYNHSGYNDLIISGLVGLRPRADDVLEVNPLIPTDSNTANAISYFCLENVLYHGRLITILYDRDGKQYNKGAGLSVYVNGQQALKPSPLGKKVVTLPPTTVSLTSQAPAIANLAANMTRNGLPAPTASSNPRDVYQAVDGRVWFYPNVRNYWTNAGSQSTSDWFSLDFGREETIGSARLYFYADGTQFKAPTSATIQYWTGQDWVNIPSAKYSSAKLLENGETTITFSPVQTSRLRAVFTNPQSASIALVEMKAFGTKTVAPSAYPLGFEGFQGENWHTGEFNATRFADATNGGFITFDLPTVPGAPNALVVKYWGSDVAMGTSERHFDILVDGQKIAEQTLNNNRPNEFFEVTYSIPETLTKDKSKVTVRFQAKPGAIAGGVFGTRIVRR